MRALIILVAGLAVGWTSLADTAAPRPAPLPAPPPMPAATDAPATTAAPLAESPRPAAARPQAASDVRATPPKAEAGSHAAAAPGELGEPSTLEQLPPAHPIAPDTRIDQVRQGNRVAEIRVTPAGSSRTYVIVTREPSRPQSLQDSGTGLSTPRFVRIEF